MTEAEAIESAALPAPHGFFTRRGGVSTGPYASLNCSLSGGDLPGAVALNRERAARRVGADPSGLVGLTQVHGAEVVRVTEPWSAGAGRRADAMVTDRPGVALGIITADCAPVLLADAEAGVVGAVQELEAIREESVRVLGEVFEREGCEVPGLLGTMIEVPRAALTAGQIAGSAEFFSFGTNDLTQTTWGFSRDDVESSVFAAYLEKGVFTVSPFETIDGDGVGRLVEIAAKEGRRTKPGLKLGVCGEHGGDPESIHFFHKTGLDYVSCSPFRVPVARLEAGRAVATRKADEGD